MCSLAHLAQLNSARTTKSLSSAKEHREKNMYWATKKAFIMYVWNASASGCRVHNDEQQDLSSPVSIKSEGMNK